MLRTRISIRNHHLRHGGSIQDGPETSTVFISDRVQDQTFAGRETDAYLPLLPTNQMSVHFKAGTLWLSDFKRLDIPTKILVMKFTGIFTRFGGNGDHAQVFDPQDHHLDEIHDGHESVNRAGVKVPTG